MTITPIPIKTVKINHNSLNREWRINRHCWALLGSRHWHLAPGEHLALLGTSEHQALVDSEHWQPPAAGRR